MNNSDPAVGRAVQADWANREFSESVKLSIRRIYDFISDFETTTRGKLATLNEKLVCLERTLDMLEAQVDQAAAVQNADKDQ